jgi:hypothetical protein
MLLSKIPEDPFGVLLLIFSAFRLNDAETANSLIVAVRRFEYGVHEIASLASAWTAVGLGGLLGGL